MRLCSVVGCERKHKAKGLCAIHYDREKKRSEYAADPAKFQQRSRENRAADPEGVRELARRYRLEHTQEIRAYDRQRASEPDRKRQASDSQKRRRRSEPEKFRVMDRERDSDPGRKARKLVDSQRWRSSNPERAKAVSRASSSRRRGRLRGVDPAGIQAAMDAGMFDLPCARCGKAGPCEIDHILPLSWSNECLVVAALGQVWCYQPLCRACNSTKRDFRLECYVPTGDIGADEGATA
jgi:hypothetical protein